MLVKWDKNRQSADNQNAYAQVEFKERYVYPTHYSLKGFSGACFSKEWNLYGFNSQSETPTLLSTNNSEGLTFCGNSLGESSGSCGNDNWGTFPIKDPKKSFRFFQIKSVTPSCSLSWYMTVKVFEVFAILSKDGRIVSNAVSLCQTNAAFNSFIIKPSDKISTTLCMNDTLISRCVKGSEFAANKAILNRFNFSGNSKELFELNRESKMANSLFVRFRSISLYGKTVIESSQFIGYDEKDMTLALNNNVACIKSSFLCIKAININSTNGYSVDPRVIKGEILTKSCSITHVPEDKTFSVDMHKCTTIEDNINHVFFVDVNAKASSASPTATQVTTQFQESHIQLISLKQSCNKVKANIFAIHTFQHL